MVKVPGSTDASVCTGFVWKQKDWIVTSLHAMHPEGNVTVIYNSGDLGIADVIKVYEKADLVLLKVRDVSSLSADVVPLTKYSTVAIPRKTEMTAIGYGLGAKASRGNPLKRGDIASPENLERALPDAAVEKLKGYEIPDLKLDIIMLDGSLLPGFSGSPIFNDKTGELIAIGEGGLENGTQALSWGIPAKYLADLEKSTNSIVSMDFTGSPLHHSSAVKITNAEVKAKIEQQPDMDVYAELELLSEQYTSIVYGDYEFYYVKTRTLEELLETSYDTENIDRIIQEFQDLGLLLATDLFEFDIYEDPVYEIIIVVPAGSLLFVDDSDVLQADLSAFDMSDYFSLSFYGGENYGGDWTSVGTNILNWNNQQPFSQSAGGLTVDEDYTHHYQIDEYSSMGWLFLSGQNLVYHEYFEDTLLPVNYFGLLVSSDFYFTSHASLLMPQIAFDYMDTTVILDCYTNYENETEACDYFETWMQIVISSHLTSYSFVQYAENEGGYDEYYEE
jgi:hypothetical protein